MFNLLNRILNIFNLSLVYLIKDKVQQPVVASVTKIPHEMPEPIDYIKYIRSISPTEMFIILPDTDSYNQLMSLIKDPFVFIKGQTQKTDETVLKVVLKSQLTKKKKTSCGITWYE